MQNSQSTQLAQLSAKEAIALDPMAFEKFRKMLGAASSELLQEMIDCYLEEAPRLLQVMQHSIGQSDEVTLRRSAHTLRSSSAILGAITLARLCQDLETRIAADVVAHIAQIETEYQKVQAALATARES